MQFRENEAQKTFNANAHSRNIILKSRQHGFTTNACINGLDNALFNRNWNFTLIADTKEHAEDIFEKIVIAWREFPLRHLYNVNTESVRELAFSHGSKVKVTTSARSGTVNELHISELGGICARYPVKAREIITGSIPAVPKDGRITIESTAEGAEGIFYELCQDFMDKVPQSVIDFKFFFFGWLDNPDNQLVGEFPIPPELKQYQALHKLTDAQIRWYARMARSLRDKMRQEYPTTPQEAFESAGNKLFSQEVILSRLKADVLEPQEFGDWKHYASFKPNHQYLLGADVAEGVGRDSCAVTIIDQNDSKVVATYVNNQIDPRLFAFEIKNGGMRFGNAFAGVERNNHGHATLGKLIEIYPQDAIYREIKTDKGMQERTMRLGWETNLASKPKILYDLKEAVEEGLLKIPSKSLLNEMLMYDFDELNEARFDENRTRHFDLLMSCAIAWAMRNYSRLKTTGALYKQPEQKPLYPSIGI